MSFKRTGTGGSWRLAAPEPGAVARDGAPAPVVTQRRRLRLGDSMIVDSFDHIATETIHDHEVADGSAGPVHDHGQFASNSTGFWPRSWDGSAGAGTGPTERSGGGGAGTGGGSDQGEAERSPGAGAIRGRRSVRGGWWGRR